MNPSGGGTAPKIMATTSVLQHWKQLQAICEVSGEEKGLEIAQYEGATTNWIGVADSADKNINKRKIDGGILLVVQARIYGHKVHALVDSGATWSFISSGPILPLGLKSTSKIHYWNWETGIVSFPKGK